MASSKGGYDYEFVSTPAKNLECSICLLVLRNPHVINCCGNHFCDPCISRVLRDKRPCPLCNAPSFTSMLHKGVMREINSLEVYCPQKAQGCLWRGELGKVECHVNLGSKDSGCGHVMMTCSHQCGGEFFRKDLKKHEVEECTERPVDNQIGQLAAQLKVVISESQKLKTELTKYKALEKKCEQLEVRNRELESRNTALEGTMQVMSARVDAIEETFAQSTQEMGAKLDAVESEKDVLKNRVAMLESLAKKVFQVETRLRRESVRIDAVEETAKKDRTELEYQCSAIEQALTPTPPFYFTLCNFDYYKSVDYQWQSSSFYTSPRGYKLSATVYPSGTNKGKGTHLSIYVAIHHGEYDEELNWPFQAVVNIQLYNYRTHAWETFPPIEFEDSDDIKFTGKPADALSNLGLGISRWVSLEEVQQRYCLNSMVRFRIPEVKVVSYQYMAIYT